jgi:hypothetical protein
VPSSNHTNGPVQPSESAPDPEPEKNGLEPYSVHGPSGVFAVM